MAHEHQERYSALVMAKLRQDNVLKDGVVFNNDYEGDPKSGAVKIPVRDQEVKVGDYDPVKGGDMSVGVTTYETFPITKDKFVNELIDGYDAASVPDNLVAERLDSAGYSCAQTIDSDGATCLLAGGTKVSIGVVDASTVYSTVVDLRKQLSKANVPNDGKRYLLATPDAYAALLKCPQFTDASNLAENVKETGAVGKIAGFSVLEWNDDTAGLAFIAGHPKFATRVNDWKVPVALNDLKDGTHIGASAVQGRMVYDHKVLRPQAVLAVYMLGVLTLTQGKLASDKCKITVAESATDSFCYRVNPAKRAVEGEDFTSGTAFVSGTTEITCAIGDTVEIIDLDNNKKAVKVGYITIA